MSDSTPNIDQYKGNYYISSDEVLELRRRISELEARLERTCTWTKSVMGNYGEYDNWATQCGEDYAIEEEWHEKPTKFCANCGGKTVEAIAGDDDDQIQD